MSTRMERSRRAARSGPRRAAARPSIAWSSATSRCSSPTAARSAGLCAWRWTWCRTASSSPSASSTCSFRKPASASGYRAIARREALDARRRATRAPVLTLDAIETACEEPAEDSRAAKRSPAASVRSTAAGPARAPPLFRRLRPVVDLEDARHDPRRRQADAVPDPPGPARMHPQAGCARRAAHDRLRRQPRGDERRPRGPRIEPRRRGAPRVMRGVRDVLQDLVWQDLAIGELAGRERTEGDPRALARRDAEASAWGLWIAAAAVALSGVALLLIQRPPAPPAVVITPAEKRSPRRRFRRSPRRRPRRLRGRRPVPPPPKPTNTPGIFVLSALAAGASAARGSAASRSRPAPLPPTRAAIAKLRVEGRSASPRPSRGRARRGPRAARSWSPGASTKLELHRGTTISKLSAAGGKRVALDQGGLKAEVARNPRTSRSGASRRRGRGRRARHHAAPVRGREGDARRRPPRPGAAEADVGRPRRDALRGPDRDVAGPSGARRRRRPASCCLRWTSSRAR